MSEKPGKVRISVTMTEAYTDALDFLVGEGLYLGRGDAILEALRLFFKGYGIAPFAVDGVEVDVPSEQ